MRFETSGRAALALAGVVFITAVAGHGLVGDHQAHTHRDPYHMRGPSRRAPVTIVTSLGSVWSTSSVTIGQ